MSMLTTVENNDIYVDYTEYSTIYTTNNPTIYTDVFNREDFFRQSHKINHKFRLTETPKIPGSNMRLGTSSGFQKGNTTGILGTGILRPMTAVRGAGYTSASRQVFDPLNIGCTIRNCMVDEEKEETPEEKIKQAERRIMILIEESANAYYEKNKKLALERARESSSRERALIRLQEQVGLSDTHNIELTFAVIFNLACQYCNSEMYTEAIVTYQAITRNKNFNNSARLKVNIGNIYVKMSQLSQAIKMYRMALDQTTTSQKYLRIKIMHNIGMLFVQMGRLEEAANSFEWVMREKPDLRAGMHAILCYFALSREDKMKRAFLELLDIQLYIDHDDKYSINTDDIATNILNEIIKNDDLSKFERELKINAEKTILNAANLIAPVIEETLAGGFAWCVDAIKSSTYSSLAANLEINKAMVFLYNKEVRMAIESLKVFENQDTKINSSASTVLSFIYFLRGEYDLTRKYCEAARIVDGHNVAAYVNLSAYSIIKNELQNAKKFLSRALEIDDNHVQALYNLGLVYKKENMYEESLKCFQKLKNIIRYDPLTLYHIGHIYQLNNNVEQAVEWYNQVLSISSDPGVLQKLGEMFDSIGDKQQAYQYYSDSYRYYPSNFDVINWLGSYFVSMQVAEKALIYFQEAAELAPDIPKWRLLVASCLRKVGQFHKALIEYQDIYKKFPDNIECLKFLVKLCSDLGLKEAQTYTFELKKIENLKENKDRHGSEKPEILNSKRSNSGTSSTGGSEISMFSEYKTSSDLHNEYILQNGYTFHPDCHILTNLSEIAVDINLHETNYNDPVGTLSIRPMTATGKKDEDFGDEQLGVDLLPE